MVNGKVELRPVVTGIQDNTYIQVVNGLKAGEKVISGPYSAISRTLKAEDEVETIAQGLHERLIISVERFDQRMQKKSAQRGAR